MSRIPGIYRSELNKVANAVVVLIVMVMIGGIFRIGQIADEIESGKQANNVNQEQGIADFLPEFRQVLATDQDEDEKAEVAETDNREVSGAVIGTSPTPEVEHSDQDNKKESDDAHQETSETDDSSGDSSDAVENAETASNSGISPTPTTVVTAPPSPTPTTQAQVVVPTSTPTQAPQPTLAPTTEPTPTEASVERSTVNLNFERDGSFTPSASGSTTIEAIKNTNGYWEFVIDASFANLQPNRNYQYWMCGDGCSSNNNAKFTSDDNGNGHISGASITFRQVGGTPMDRIMIWEMPENGAEIISDSTTCYMISNGSTGCLKASVAW